VPSWRRTGVQAMAPAHLVGRFLAASRRSRARFGHVRGTFFWLQVRQGSKRPAGREFAVRAPGFLHPIFLRAGTSDLGVLQQIIVNGGSDFDLGTHPAFIIDAVANIGLTCLAFARRYPSAKIVALEVDEDNFNLLCRNVLQYPNITPLRAALWSHVEFVRIRNPGAEAWAFQVERASASDPGAIPATTVGRLLESFAAPQISLLKLDIEGSEREVLSEGDQSWVERTETLAVELHDRFRPGCTKALNELLSNRPHRRVTHGEYEVVYLG